VSNYTYFRPCLVDIQKNFVLLIKTSEVLKTSEVYARMYLDDSNYLPTTVAI